MRIAAITDLHGDLDSLEKLAPELAHADVVLVCGDITTFGRAQGAGVAEMLEALAGCSGRVLAVPGNCDTPAEVYALDEAGVNLHARSEVIGGVAFLGIGGSLECPARTPIEMPEHAFRQLLAEEHARVDPALPLVLAVHQPPYGTVNDRIPSGKHVGSREVRRFIETVQPAICFTGHIHEGAGMDQIGSTPVVNPGPVSKLNYAVAELHGHTATVEIRSMSSRRR